MKEDLNLFQNQYNYIVVAWTVGYIIGQWVRNVLVQDPIERRIDLVQPSNFILTRVKAHSETPTPEYLTISS